jgi:hypothetical protein
MKITQLSCTAILVVASATGISMGSASKAVSITPQLTLLPSNFANTAFESPPARIAQAVGECRQTRRLERIYSAADLAAAQMLDVQPGTSVTVAGLANQPSFGWMRISYPADGYIQTAFLQACGTPMPAPSPTPNPTPQGNACGVVTAPDLAVRSAPNTESGYRGTVSQTQGFQITSAGQTQTAPAAESGRIWVQISRYSLTGWVAETGPGGSAIGGTNFRRVTCSSIGLP